MAPSRQGVLEGIKTRIRSRGLATVLPVAKARALPPLDWSVDSPDSQGISGAASSASSFSNRPSASMNEVPLASAASTSLPAWNMIGSSRL
jgi:hypothetical protein